MNLEQLANIVEVASTRSLTEAAINRNVTLPALSQSISQLEKELNLKLFTRSRVGTFPTNNGEQIIKRANAILEQVYMLQEDVQRINQDIRGKFKLGTLPGYMSLIIQAITNLSSVHPSIQSYLIEGNSESLYECLLEQKIELAIMSFTNEEIEQSSKFKYEKIVQCKIVLAVHPDHPFASKKSISMIDVLKTPLALHEDPKIVNLISLFEKQFGKAEIVMITNNTDSIRQVIAHNQASTIGLDYTFLNDPFIQQHNIVLVELELPKEETFIGIVRLKNVHLTEINRLVINHLKQTF